MGLEPWARRAFLAGAACRPKDERNYWYGAIRPQLDSLEQRIVAWVKAGHFGSF